MAKLKAEEKAAIDSMMDRISKIGKDQEIAADDTARKLVDGEIVTDGELLDSLFTLITGLKFPDPLIVIGFEAMQRLMTYGGIAITPGGVERDWFDEKD